MLARFQIAVPLIAVFFGSPIKAEDWPMFGRDQHRNAVSPEKNPPTWWEVPEWDRRGKLTSSGKNIRWSAPLGQSAYGDPVVVDGMVWVGTWTIENASKAVLLCLDEKTGAELYRYASPRLEDSAKLHDLPFHSMACSPLIEGDRLWFTTNRCEVVCLDIGPVKKRTGAARELWKVDMRKDLGVFPRRSGVYDCRHCSVVSHKDWIYVITGNGVGVEEGKVVTPEAPSLVCFNKHTGKVVWKDNSPGKNIMHSQFASPTLIEIKGQIQIVAPQGDGWVRGFEPSTGKPLWQFDTNPPDATWDLENKARSTRNYLPATAVFHENRLYIGNGHEPEHQEGPAWLYCIDPGRRGDISPHVPNGPGKFKPNPNSGLIWKFGGVDEKSKENVFARTVSNVTVHQGLLVACSLAGDIYCLDAKTGHLFWKHDAKGSVYGNALIVEGKVYVGSEDGVWILELDKEKKVLGRLQMDGVLCSPVYANGVLYLAAHRHLFAIAANEKKPQP